MEGKRERRGLVLVETDLSEAQSSIIYVIMRVFYREKGQLLNRRKYPQNMIRIDLYEK